MGDAESQNEPTMEEILASIRRIISEDEPEEDTTEGSAAHKQPAEAAGAEEAPADLQAVAEPASDEPPPQAEAEAQPEAHPEPQSEAEVLELTSMVNPDGSVTDLKDGAPADGEPAPEPEERPEPAPEAEPTAASAETAPAGQDSEPEPEKAAGDTEAPAEASAAAQHDGLVSAATAALATGAMAEITRMASAAGRSDAGPTMGGGRTLEDVVREALIPELRVWLDANLPQLVERIVREEIRKMVRRAEQQ